MVATHVALGQETRAELHVIFEIKRADGLELGAESGEGGRFIDLLHATDATELPLRVLRDGEASCPAIATAVVVVGDGAGLRRHGAIWVVGSHGMYCDGVRCESKTAVVNCMGPKESCWAV